MIAHPSWWQTAVVHLIYPWSFQDSNSDGIGDISGIFSRLDYLNDGTPDSLGVDAIWLSPIIRPLGRIFGYDVADYRDIDPRFDTLEDFDRLIRETKRQGVRSSWTWSSITHQIDIPGFRKPRTGRDPARTTMQWDWSLQVGCLLKQAQCRLEWINERRGSVPTQQPA